jgi:hypothetical protein
MSNWDLGGEKLMRFTTGNLRKGKIPGLPVFFLTVTLRTFILNFSHSGKTLEQYQKTLKWQPRTFPYSQAPL